MKVLPSRKKKNNVPTLWLRLSVRHSAASRLLINDRRLHAVSRRTLLAAQQRGRFALSLAFVDDRAMRRLNRMYADHDYTTDVLSFSAREDTGHFYSAPSTYTLLGDIVIALPQAKRQARTAGHAPAHEVAVLLAHGVLHLLGYDHATAPDAIVMQTLQDGVVAVRPDGDNAG